MATNITVYIKTALTGGTSDALDGINGSDLINDDTAFVYVSYTKYEYRLNATSGAAESSPDIIAPDTNPGNKRWILVSVSKLIIPDTNASNNLNIKWNENDTSDRTLNLKVNSGDRTLDLSENLTISNGYDITITAEDAAAAIVLDNSNFEVENTNATQRSFKITSAKAGNTTLTFQEDLTIADGYAVTITAEDATGAIVLDNANFEVENTDGTQRNVKITSAKAGNTTLTFQENFTIGDGYAVTITAEDAAGAIVLDNANFEVEDTVGSGKTIKIANASTDANKTITLGGDLSIGDPTSNETNLAAKSNLDVDTGTETVDSFADTIGAGAVWFYTVKNGANVRTGIMIAAWDDSGDTVQYAEGPVTLDVGDTSDMTLVVDIDSNNVRLRATAASDDWIVRTQRMIL